METTLVRVGSRAHGSHGHGECNIGEQWSVSLIAAAMGLADRFGHNDFSDDLDRERTTPIDALWKFTLFHVPHL